MLRKKVLVAFVALVVFVMGSGTAQAWDLIADRSGHGRVTLRAEDALDVYLAHAGDVKKSPPANIQCPSCGSVLPAAAASCEVCGWAEPG